MLHRWLAYITIGQAILHSILYLHVAVVEGKHKQWVVMQAWYCGSIASIAFFFTIVFSIVTIRRRAYEFFLLVHIALSVLVLVGTYIHVSDLFNTKWSGYVLYLWIAIVFWAFDRLARIFRLARNGIARATVTIIDDEYVRVDIHRAKAQGHAYLYFPTLTYRFWENHPFSVATSQTTALETSQKLKSSITPSLTSHMFSLFSQESASSTITCPSLELKSLRSYASDETGPKSPMGSILAPISPMSPGSAYFPFPPTPSDKSFFAASPTSTTNLVLPYHEDKEKPLPPKPAYMTFFMRTHSGMTSLLRKRTSLPVLVEASYGLPKNLDRYPILICIAGGVGITAILPYLHAHKGATRLFWGSRSRALVSALREETRGNEGEIVVGKRLFVKLTLQREFARVADSMDIAVVVSGPKGMANDVREFVCKVARTRVGDVRFLDESFGW
jgi:predicted ferric reductase